MGAGARRRVIDEDTVVCAGAPLDAAGRPREAINDCPFEPTAVVVGVTPHPTSADGWAAVFVVACDVHAKAIAQVVPEGEVLALAALPYLRDEYGEDLWQMVPAVA